MELTLNLDYGQILELMRQLPVHQIERMKEELTEDFVLTKPKSEISDFQKFILSGPVMSDSQYEELKAQRFVDRWAGFLKEENIDFEKNKYEYLSEKYR